MFALISDQFVRWFILHTCTLHVQICVSITFKQIFMIANRIWIEKRRIFSCENLRGSVFVVVICVRMTVCEFRESNRLVCKTPKPIQMAHEKKPAQRLIFMMILCITTVSFRCGMGRVGDSDSVRSGLVWFARFCLWFMGYQHALRLSFVVWIERKISI